jgi:hypothetical protein
MGLENLIAYGVVFGVPFWLVTEEVLHRVGPHLKAALTVRLRHRAPKNAPMHAHVVGS